MKHALAVLLIVVALCAGPAAAKDTIGKFQIHGVGNSSCPEFLGEYARSRLEANNEGKLTAAPEFGNWLSWFEGYTTRTNETAKNTSNAYGMKVIDMVKWVASWCRDNPSRSYVDAVSALTSSRTRPKGPVRHKRK